jgi:hypothetical protein
MKGFARVVRVLVGYNAIFYFKKSGKPQILIMLV